MQLCGDDLGTFIHNWESVIAGLNHQPEETTLRDILLRQVRNASKLKFDLEVYDRATEGSLGAPAPSEPTTPRGELPREPHPKAEKAQEKAAKGKDKKDTSEIPCLFYPKGTCKNGKNCPFLHKDASPSVPAKGDGDKGGKPKSPSSKRRRPSKKRGKSAEKTAAC